MMNELEPGSYGVNPKHNEVEYELDLVNRIFVDLGCTEEITKEYIRESLSDIILFDSKQKDYGRNNISVFGEYGVLIRTSDKIQRLIALSKQDQLPLNEAIEDSWKDISIYGVIARLVRHNLW